MTAKPTKGWFKTPGIRPDGDRTLEEQMMGLAPALAEVKGKTVLDLGCAEGLIAREFALAGADHVHGIELLATHLEVAAKACEGIGNISFQCAHLAEFIEKNPQPPKFDIVLALGIAHKLSKPCMLIRWAAISAKSLVLFRAPARDFDGVIHSKHTRIACDVPLEMAELGFVKENKISGVRGEAVEYWRRGA